LKDNIVANLVLVKDAKSQAYHPCKITAIEEKEKNESFFDEAIPSDMPE